MAANHSIQFTADPSKHLIKLERTANQGPKYGPLRERPRFGQGHLGRAPYGEIDQNYSGTYHFQMDWDPSQIVEIIDHGRVVIMTGTYMMRSKEPNEHPVAKILWNRTCLTASKLELRFKNGVVHTVLFYIDNPYGDSDYPCYYDRRNSEGEHKIRLSESSDPISFYLSDLGPVYWGEIAIITDLKERDLYTDDMTDLRDNIVEPYVEHNFKINWSTLIRQLYPTLRGETWAPINPHKWFVYEDAQLHSCDIYPGDGSRGPVDDADIENEDEQGREQETDAILKALEYLKVSPHDHLDQIIVLETELEANRPFIADRWRKYVERTGFDLLTLLPYVIKRLREVGAIRLDDSLTKAAKAAK